jgi:hypothetical protein
MSGISPQQKKDPRKRERERERGARIEKKKRWNLSWKAPCFEKIEDKIYKLLGEILSKERKKGDHNFL